MKPQLTYKELKQTFVIFLKDNNALKQFKENLLTQRKREFKNLTNYLDILTLDRFNTLIEEETLYELINHAFHWASTPQGHDYWSELDEKWRGIMMKYQNKLKTSRILK